MIDRLYNEINVFILDDINDNYKDRVADGLKKYLNEKYKNSFSDPNTAEKRLKAFINLEKKYWSNAPVLNKLSFFVYDENYEQLNKLSNDIFVFAKEKMLNGYNVDKKPTIEEINTTIDGLKQLSDNVEYFNSSDSRNLLSETIMDYLYIYTDTDEMSLRLGREYQKKKEIEELKKKKINN